MSIIGAKVIIEIIKDQIRVDQNLEIKVRIGHTRNKVCVKIVKSLST